ncbi:MAG: hypothetical protein GX575_14825 [Candidatus Anammoximicrobium sp.]|nr:hypothetical protein [Candidatus Anammoximicrobium sp.]
MANPTSTAGLIANLSQTWSASAVEGASGLVRAIARSLTAAESGAEISAKSEHAIRFKLDLSGVHLRGMGSDVPCLLIGGGVQAGQELRRFFAEHSGTLQIPLVFCAAATTRILADDTFPKQWAAVFGPSDLRRMLDSDRPGTDFRQTLWLQIGRRRLNPYNITRPAPNNTFFGRQRELDQLRDDTAHSFAIAGPGQIGKSSLLLQHRWDLIRRRDPRISRMFTVDFFNLMDLTPDGVARHIATAIDPGKASHELSWQDLPKFILKASLRLGGRLELLLDEVDRICDSPALELLGHEAKGDQTRLILCGRKKLLDLMLSPNSALGGRVKLIRPQPLDTKSAHDLIVLPLADLGITLSDAHLNLIVNHIQRMSGNLPHLLQLYCQRLAELAIEHDWSEVKPKHLAELESGEFRLMVLGPVFELTPERQALVVRMLRSGKPSFTVNDVAQLAGGIGTRQATGICLELYIQNILNWDREAFRLANEAIPRFAKEVGLLES